MLVSMTSVINALRILRERGLVKTFSTSRKAWTGTFTIADGTAYDFSVFDGIYGGWITVRAPKHYVEVCGNKFEIAGSIRRLIETSSTGKYHEDVFTCYGYGLLF